MAAMSMSAVSADGLCVLSAVSGGVLRVSTRAAAGLPWGEAAEVRVDVRAEITCVCVAPNAAGEGRAFAIALADGGVRIVRQGDEGAFEVVASPDDGGRASRAKAAGGPAVDAAFAPGDTSAGTCLAVLSADGGVRLFAPRAKTSDWECVEALASAAPGGAGASLAWRVPNRAAADLCGNAEDAAHLTRAWLAVGGASGVSVLAHRPELRRWERIALIETDAPVTALCFRPPTGALADGRECLAVAVGPTVTRYALVPRDVHAPGVANAPAGAAFAAAAVPLAPDAPYARTALLHPGVVWRLEYNDASTALVACFEHAPSSPAVAYVWAPDLGGEWAVRARVAADGALLPP